KISNMPMLSDFDPFGIYCIWELTLVSPSATLNDIAEVFEFVEGNCDLSIVQLTKTAAPAEPSLADLAAIVAPPAIVDDVPCCAALAETVKKDAPVRAPVAAVPVAPRPEPAVAAPVLVDEIEDRRIGPEDRRGAAIQSIRVDLDKVDRVVNMVGDRKSVV